MQSKVFAKYWPKFTSYNYLFGLIYCMLEFSEKFFLIIRVNNKYCTFVGKISIEMSIRWSYINRFRAVNKVL